jgi:dTDP-4-dehydrorhamnose reductase
MAAQPSSDDPWLIIGASGLLGHGLCRFLVKRGARVVATVHRHDVGVPGVEQVPCELPEIEAVLTKWRPRTVVYAAGITSVDQCESDESHADRMHAEIPANIARLLKALGGRLIYISTDHLWSGTRSMVDEQEPLEPMNAYARSKARGERLIAAANPSTLILRTNFFGEGRPWRQSLSDWMLGHLRSGTPFNAFSDAYFTPIALSRLHDIIVSCIAMELSGIYHACGVERLSKYDFAIRLAHWHGLPTTGIQPGFLRNAGLIAPRPADMSLSTNKLSLALGKTMPSIEESFASEFLRSGAEA